MCKRSSVTLAPQRFPLQTATFLFFICSRFRRKDIQNNNLTLLDATPVALALCDAKQSSQSAGKVIHHLSHSAHPFARFFFYFLRAGKRTTWVERVGCSEGEIEKSMKCVCLESPHVQSVQKVVTPFEFCCIM